MKLIGSLDGIFQPFTISLRRLNYYWNLQLKKYMVGKRMDLTR